MNAHFTRALSLLIGITLSASALGQTEPAMMDKRHTGQSFSEPIPHNLCEPDGVANGGYDLLSYRQDGGPLVGLKEFTVSYNGLKYLFVNDNNRVSFLEEPERYLPEYNGFCAITLALGRVTCPQYDNFKIEDDKLLLFEVTGFTNGRILWNSEPADFRSKADSNFLQIDH
ncbi:MAG: hypothetical protein ACI97K_001955 [Glaciecola sp.]|jgi:hypothetical protein